MNTEALQPFPEMATERLLLRQLSATDQQEIFALRSSVDINRYIDRQPARTIEDAQKFIQQVLENSSRKDSCYWAITLREKDRLIGALCIFSFSEENNSCEIGYELLPGFQGKGLMKEAVNKVIDFAFNRMEFQKIEALVHKDNLASRKLLEKCLFTLSGKHDEKDPDFVHYRLNRD